MATIHMTEEYLDQLQEIGVGKIFGFIGFGILALFMILGLVTEKSFLFGREYYVETKEIAEVRDKALVESKNGMGKFFLSFSPSRNLQKIFFSRPPADKDLEVLNGVRVLSICWVLLGHAYFNSLTFPSQNIMQVENLTKAFLFIIVPGGFFAVDMFFWLSSFLATYLML